MTEKMQKVCDVLNQNKIDYRLAEHPAVYTIDEMLVLNLPDFEAVAKNLFVRDDKKRNYYLLVVRQDKKVELKAFRDKIGSRNLSFASEEDLNAILGLSKGAVTPFGVLNDDRQTVQVLLDTAFRDGVIGVHPNENTATVWLKTADLASIIKQHGNSVEYAEF